MLEVYYNNNCSVCRIEINHYIRKNTKNIKWIDISNNKKAEIELDKSARQLLRRLHVKHDSEIYEGAQAFIILWDRLPGYRWLSKLASFPVVYQLFYITYEIVAIFLYLKNRGQLNDS
tara:strand:- start:600 stop:953 length:354 start_codon:yes stop_codon:yes gene_type:complete